MLNGLGAPVAILLSAFAAGVFSLCTMFWSRKIVRDRATIDLVNRTAWDGDFIKARNVFAKLREEPNGLVNCCNDVTSADYKAVIQFLNHYELVAIGTGNGILSEAVFKKFFRTRYVKDWQAAKAFVEAVRANSGNELLYVEYEKCARKWQKTHKQS